MERKELDKLYCLLCDLLEDMSPNELAEYRDKVREVKDYVIKRINVL